MENKDLIIQDLKDVIVDLNSNDAVKIRNKETIINNEKYFKLINDLNICQSEIIKELQLENSEITNQSKFFENAYYACCGVIVVLLTAIYYIK